MIENTLFPRFRLRTVMILVALLGVGFAFLTAYMRSPPDRVNQATLNTLVARITTGMTAVQISDVFGFEPRPHLRELSANYNGKVTWTFIVTDRKGGWHGNELFYVGIFLDGRLMQGAIYGPM